MRRSRRTEAGFVLTLEALLMIVLVGLPLVVGVTLLARRSLTAYANERQFLELPDAQAVVVDSSSNADGEPKVLGSVIAYDRFEAPVVVFRDDKNNAGVALGVRGQRLTTYAEVFYDDAACTVNPMIRTYGSGVTSSGNIPTGALYQGLHAAYAMGNKNILYTEPSAFYTSLDRIERWWAAAGGLMSDAWRGMQAFVPKAVDTAMQALLDLSVSPLQAQGIYYLFTGQTGAQPQIDVNHTKRWTMTVTSGTLSFGGGTMTMKRGTGARASATLTVLNAAGVSQGAVTRNWTDFTGSYKQVAFNFGTPLSLSAGTYTVTLTSPAPDVQSQAFFIKTGGSASFVATTSDGSTPAANVLLPAVVTLAKVATAVAQIGSSITYTIALGNSGQTATGTTITVADQLPADVVATAVTPGTNVSGVSCGTLPSSAGALLTCTVTLAAGIPAGAPNGAATFNISATAPASVPSPASITNYASVDETGGSSPPTPGAACTGPNCGSAATTVQVPPPPANVTLEKAASVVGSTVTFTVKLGNDGGSATGTSVAVLDQLPLGVFATAVTAGTNVSSVSCGGMPSADGALLSCSVVLTGGIPAYSANGWATFTITTNSFAEGSPANYASASEGTPPTPGDTCLSASCGSAVFTASTSAVGYVWRSQDISPDPGGAAPNPPCFPVFAKPSDLVAAKQVVDFDSAVSDGPTAVANSNPYTRPFRVLFRTRVSPPALSCPTGECP